MWNVTRKGLLAHKLRLALTGLAIVLGVTFISGAFVLTDTLHDTFTSLVGNVYQHIDFEVRGRAALDSGADAIRNPIPASVIAKVRRVPGVAAADGSVAGYAQYVVDGNAISGGGATAGISFDPNRRLSAFQLAEGRAPSSPDDVVMDLGTARKYHVQIGDHVRILLPRSPQTFTVSGFLRFGTADNLAGATIAAFDLPTAQELFGLAGKLDTINVLTAPGADKATVQRDIARVLPRGAEVVTGQTVVDEQATDIDQALSVFSTALVIFALIALLVGGFTIFNTFSITLGQRTRELALLRIVGASRRQVLRSVLAEAAVVGALASLIGLGLGALAAEGLEALLDALGESLPSGALVFAPRTVVVGLAVGIGVTVISAVNPARRAVRIPPVAAITAPSAEPEVPSRRRLATGGGSFVVGIVVLAIGLATSAVALVGLGAVAIFIAVGMLGPMVARPLASVIGRPAARLLGVSGRLGRENSMRSPRRTAQTSAALMVGLALVSAMAVLGASLSTSTTSSIDNAVNADLVVTGPSSGFPSSVVRAVSSVPGVTASTTAYRGQFELRGALSTVVGVTVEHLADTVILHMQAGTSRAALAAGQMLIDTTTARSDHLSVGSIVPVRFALTGSSTIRVGGIFEPNALIGHYLVGGRFFLSHFSDPLPIGVLLTTDARAGILNAVSNATSPYPNVGVQTRARYEASQVANINQLLHIVDALLALAVLIALIGIVNTLLLSVFERTREIGLLRAVGMRRRQVRAMICSEAMILSLFGAILGIVVGTGLGSAVAASLERSQQITGVAIPFPSLVVLVVVVALLGLVAATWPARRAARLDVLVAISAE
ncbi:MAG TPA: FtsX-like permease family protein [Acidimicrobiales bacterium]|nr:FtsX-like permease family protein [Acidimicrobiales bacterium]